jgi:hypothetical protein
MTRATEINFRFYIAPKQIQAIFERFLSVLTRSLLVVVSGGNRRGNAPCLDFDDTGIAGEYAGNVYPNPVGSKRSEA